MEIGRLQEEVIPFAVRLDAAREAVGEPVDWYLYNTLANVGIIDAMLTGEDRELDSLAAGLPVADIGAGDGELAFLLESVAGMEVDIIDNSSSNMNRLRGAQLLKEALGSGVGIHDIDLDTQFRLPRERYGLVLMLGLLYHLQNPFYALREIALRAHHCLLNTKVARLAGPEGTAIAELPVGYLVGPAELNDDATNYWIFSPAGLERLVERAGWEVVSRLDTGDTATSRPDSAEADERMLMLLRSTVVEAA
jgi:hypothetical protein